MYRTSGFVLGRPGDLHLQVPIRWNADHVVDAGLFQRLVDLRFGEGGVGQIEPFALSIADLDGHQSHPQCGRAIGQRHGAVDEADGQGQKAED